MAKQKPLIDRILAVYVKAKGKPRSVTEVAKLLNVNSAAVYHPASRLVMRKLLQRVAGAPSVTYVASPLALGAKPAASVEPIVEGFRKLVPTGVAPPGEQPIPEPRTGGSVTPTAQPTPKPLPTMTYDNFCLIADLLEIPVETALYLATKALLQQMQEAQ